MQSVISYLQNTKIRELQIQKLLTNRRVWLLAFLASQFVILQLLTGVEYYDAPRNLHWGIFLSEQPGYLLNAGDYYDRINGFPPSPPSLAPAGYATDLDAQMLSWWGPAYLLAIALIWKLTSSFTAIQLLVPLAGGALVLLTYGFGKRYLDERTGLLAAFLLAFFPIFREHAVMAFLEPVSALLLLGIFWAYLSRRTWLTIGLASVALLGKIDAIPLYFGTVLLTAAANWRSLRDRTALRHSLLSLGVPAIPLIIWLFLAHVVYQRSIIVGGRSGLDVLSILIPLTVPHFFNMMPAISELGLCVFGIAAIVSLRRQEVAKSAVSHLLLAWLGIGILVFLIYMANPAASNNPRVFIPALPALCLLGADGLLHMHFRLRKVQLSFILAVLLLGNFAGILNQIIMSKFQEARMPVWETLRDAPESMVLTEDYWECILYARQPATWFAHDPRFEKNILHNLENFRNYLETTPIQYIVLPTSEEALRSKTLSDPLVQIYLRLPPGLGRMLDIRSEALVSSDVRQFLDRSFPRNVVGDYIVYSVNR